MTLTKLKGRRAKLAEEDAVAIPKDPYCSWDGRPALWTPGEAWAFMGGTETRVAAGVWVFPGGAWKPVNSSVVGMEAADLSEAAFKAKFPGLPAPPREAFHTYYSPVLDLKAVRKLRRERWPDKLAWLTERWKEDEKALRVEIAAHSFPAPKLLH